MDAAARPSSAAIFHVVRRLGTVIWGGGLPGWMHREVIRKRG